MCPGGSGGTGRGRPRGQGDGQLAEGREDEIVHSQSEGRSDLGGLLAFEGGVDGQLALALQGHAFAIQATGEDHPAQQLSQLVERETDIGVADGRAVGRDEAERLAAAPWIGG